MKSFLQYNKSTYGLSDEAISLLEQNMHIVKLSKGETVISQGNANHNLYFVSTGLVRCWFEKDEKEYCLSFAFEGDIAIIPFEGSKHSPISAIALEESTLIYINQDKLEALFTESSELAIWEIGRAHV